MTRPLLLPLASLVGGLSLGGCGPWFFPQGLVAPFLAITLLTIFLKSRFPFLAAVSLTVFVAGNLSLQPYLAVPPDDIAASAGDGQVVIEGVIDARPEAQEQGVRVTVATEHLLAGKRLCTVSGRLLLSIEEGRGSFMTGDRIRFASRVRRPRKLGLPGEFDYERYLAWRGIHATAFVKSVGDVIVIREGAGFALQRRIDRIAAHLASFIDRTVPPVEAGVLDALLLGYMGGVTQTIRDAYSSTGVNHILSISGFHIGIIALFIFQILMLAARSSETLLLHVNIRSLVPLVSLPVLVFYLFLTGAAPATLRSVIMIATFITALVLKRDVDTLDALILAALLILGLSPAALFDVSFQLSFLALWGIVVLTPIFMKPWAAMGNGLVKRIITVVMASAAAITATLLPVVYYFHRASATGLLANLIIIPLMGYGAVIAGFSALPLVYLAPPLAAGLLHVAAFLVAVSDAVILRLARLPQLPVFSPSPVQLALSYLFLSALSFVRAGRPRLFCCGCLALLGAATVIMSSTAEKGLKITFLSIGQGDAALVTFPDGRHMLVDGGGSAREGGMDVGERLLAPALWKLGIHRLDFVVLSHPHPDHLQGLRYVVANFPVGEFWESGFHYDSKEYLELKRLVAERRIPVRRVNAATPAREIAGCRIEPLAPFVPVGGPLAGDFDGANEESVVFRLVRGSFAILFTGDIGRVTEERLADVAPERLHCTILKVPHHGSSHSSSPPFLDATAPRVAVISAGFNNSFHLPTHQTLDALKRRGVRVYRTDFDGTIEAAVNEDGKNVAFRSLM
jgi:competence protein ComEC